MGQTGKPTRQNRTITVDFHAETTYAALLGNTKAFLEVVFAFLRLWGMNRGNANEINMYVFLLKSVSVINSITCV